MGHVGQCVKMGQRACFHTVGLCDKALPTGAGTHARGGGRLANHSAGCASRSDEVRRKYSQVCHHAALSAGGNSTDAAVHGCRVCVGAGCVCGCGGSCTLLFPSIPLAKGTHRSEPGPWSTR